MTIHVRKAGLLTTVQGAPRSGLRHLGVPASGPGAGGMGGTPAFPVR